MNHAIHSDVVEHEDFEGVIDEVNGIVRGVKLLGLRSRNKRIYDTPGVRKTALNMLEGAKIYLDHPENPLKPRSYRDSFGVALEVEFRAGSGYFGTVKYNVEHANAKQFAWDVKNNQKSLGMSINARNRYGKTRSDGDVEVEQIELLRSIDIVTKPATADGIFESVEDDPIMDLKTLREKHPDLFEQVLEEVKDKASESAEIASLKKINAEALEQLNVLKAEAESRKIREAVEADFSTFLDVSAYGADKDLRKEILECACQMQEEARRPYRTVIEKMAKLSPMLEDDGVDPDADDEVPPVEEHEVEEEVKFVVKKAPDYRPGAGRKAKPFSLKEHLGIK